MTDNALALIERLKASAAHCGMISAPYAASACREAADALQAMHARAEKAERGRDYWQKQHDERTFFLGQCATEKETAEARMKDAMGLLDHLIGWIVHDCGAEPPFTSEQDETYAALKGDHHD